MNKQNFKKVTPIAYTVLVEVPKPAEKTAGGIYLSETARDREAMINTVGTILEIAESAFSEEHWQPKPKIGDKILFEKLAGQQVNINGKNARLIKDEQVRAIVEVSDE
jgi:chaperonin GroES